MGFIIPFILLYFFVNYYILIRLLQAFQIVPFKIKIVITAIFIISALSYIIAKTFLSNVNSALYDIFLWIGSVWYSFLLYGLISVILLDIIRLTNNWRGYLPQSLLSNYPLTKFWTGLIIVVAISLITVLGYFNAKNIKLKNLEFTFPKMEGKLDEMTILFFSDLHLTPVNDSKMLTQLIDFSEAENPDLILIGGDLIDDKPMHLKRIGIDKMLPQFKCKYGIYAINGNHEFINGIDVSDKFIEDCGIPILRDTTIEIDGSIQIIGREDRSIKEFAHKDRKPLNEIIKTLNPNLPSILLDHQPFKLSEAQSANINLELSGHTHYAQFFPLNFILYLIYEKPWGSLKKGNTHYYISCGAGTWGPPIRTGSDSEAMLIKIKFE